MHLINENYQTDPKNFQNYTWINLCYLLPIQKVLKSNPNSIVTLTPNLIKSFSTLWFFFWDTSFCKLHTWHVVQNLFHFLPHPPRMKSWDLDQSYDFLTSFAFLEFKNHSATRLWSCFRNKMFEISFHFPDNASHRTQ